mmetsp:Transcript_41245/g.119250  ORF Transcript_41245/g.119250 Transcript_41245/m.119250 type:complete len:364 (-) Transcript_41245:6-1097(-)
MSAILPHSSATRQTPPPAAPPAGSTARQWPEWRRSPPSQPPLSANERMTVSKAAKTSSSTTCSAMSSRRSSRLSTKPQRRCLSAAATRRPAATAHQGRTSTQPLEPRRPPSTQSAAMEVAKTPPPKKTNMALLVLRQMPRQEANRDTTMKTTALGSIAGASPRCSPLRYLQNMTSAASANAMKTRPRKAMTMSGRISVRMLGLLSPSRAWRSLKHNWMYGHDANHDATIKTKQRALPSHTGMKTIHHEALYSKPRAADAEMTRAPCEKTKASLPATSSWRVRSAVRSGAERRRNSWAPSGSKIMGPWWRVGVAPLVFLTVVGKACGSSAAWCSPPNSSSAQPAARRSRAANPRSAQTAQSKPS